MNELLHKLDAIERFAGGTKSSRLAANPFRYLKAMYLGKLVYPYTHRGSLQEAPLFFGGSMQVLLPAATDIYLSGGKTHDSEIRLARFMIHELKAGQTYLDIGAHFGYFSLLASALVGKSGKVFSIEAGGNTHSLLRKNAAGKDNIEVLHNAVSDTDGTVSFYEFPVLYSEYNTLRVEQFREKDWIEKYAPDKVEVQAITIDKLCATCQMNPAMIKIDVEGAEAQAIRGGSEILHQLNPYIIMEYLDEDDTTGYKEAADILQEQGYISYMIDKQGKLYEERNILDRMRLNNITSENIVFKK